MERTYIITNGRGEYISTFTNIHIVEDLKHATPFNKDTAQNIISNMPRRIMLASKWSILPVETKEPTKEEPKAKIVTDEELFSTDEIASDMLTLAKIFNKYDNYVRDLPQLYNRVEKEKLDRYHRIEMTALNVVDGYKAYKDMQICLKKRRMIKDAQVLFGKMPVSAFSNGAEMEQNIFGFRKWLEVRVYTSRINESLTTDRDELDDVIKSLDMKRDDQINHEPEIEK